MKFTVFIREANNEGTTYITSGDADNLEEAKRYALAECSAAWGEEDYPVETLHVLGVAEGDVTLLEWTDV